MRHVPRWAILTAAAFGLLPDWRVRAGEEDGVALAILYDTSGSMQDSVRNAAGKQEPKFVIADRALQMIAGQLQAFSTNAQPGETHRIDAGLFTFSGSGAKVAVKFGPLDARAIERWAESFSTPGGGTPLGNALRTAAQTVLDSPLPRKHVLVITDGNNTLGPPPARVIPALNRLADQKQCRLAVHFVAFDVAASAFDSVKRLGASVVSAADEQQLNTQLNFILRRQILLEKENTQ
jgi:uncharacterized protein YegL